MSRSYQFGARYPDGAPAFAASAILKATGGRLEWVEVYNASGSTLYLQLFDSATLPANGAVPIAVVQVPTKNTVAIDYSQSPFPFDNGIVACLSSTDITKTIHGSPEGLFTAVFL